MPTDAEKVKNLRSKLHLTQWELAEHLNVKHSRISMIECGKNKLSLEMKTLIKEKFNYDIDAEEYISYSVQYNTKSLPVPFYHIKAAANPSGGIMIMDYPEEEALYFDIRWLKNILGVNPYNVSILEAKGDSMIPDIQDGDLLLIDNSDTEIINNKTYIIEINGELLVKKLVKDFNGKTYLISNNPNYPKRELTESDNALIKGRVVWNGSRNNV